MKTLLDWFRDRRSKTIVKLMLDHLVKVLDTNSSIKEAVHCSIATTPDKENIYAAITAVHLNEKAGDSIKADLSETISGAINLPSRYILIRLANTIDSIANWTNAAAKNLHLAHELGFYIPKKPLEIVETMLTYTNDCILSIRRAIKILPKNPEKALEICNTIQSIETNVDELYFDARKELLKLELSPAALISLLDLLLGIEQANDACANSADSIVAIIMTGL